MANENVRMWTELNIDLKSHDMLMNVWARFSRKFIFRKKIARPAWVFTIL